MLALRNAEDDRERARERAAAACLTLSICPKSGFAARAEKLHAYLTTDT
jgi:hypothetical protein